MPQVRQHEETLRECASEIVAAEIQAYNAPVLFVDFYAFPFCVV